MKNPQYYLQYVVLDSMEDVCFRNDYSGRAMYGRSCVGVTGSRSDCQAVIAEAIIRASIDSQKVQAGSSREETDECFRQLVAELLNFQQDSMGMDIILYWPNLQPIIDEEPES